MLTGVLLVTAILVLCGVILWLGGSSVLQEKTSGGAHNDMGDNLQHGCRDCAHPGRCPVTVQAKVRANNRNSG